MLKIISSRSDSCQESLAARASLSRRCNSCWIIESLWFTRIVFLCLARDGQPFRMHCQTLTRKSVSYDRSHRYWPTWTRWPVLIIFALILAWVFSPKRVRYSRLGLSVLWVLGAVTGLGILFWLFSFRGILAAAK
jgi:hypothetical protein